MFAYWGPTWILGKYDMVLLEEPAYDAAKFARLNDPKQDPAGAGVAFPSIPVTVVVNSKFHKKAPQLVEFLTKYRTSNKLTSEALAYMQDNKGSTAKDAAIHFLKTKEDVWTTWVPVDVVKRVKSSL